MANIADLAGPAVKELSTRSEAELYQELALRVRGISDNPAAAGDMNLTVDYSPELMGPLDDLQDFGRRFLARFLPDAYSLVCGDDDSEERKKILDAFGAGPEIIGGLITAALVANLAIAPAAAAVVATLILRLFFRPTYQAMCEVWKKKLPAPA